MLPRDGAELWYFKTPPITWKLGARRRGVANPGGMSAHTATGVSSLISECISMDEN